MKMNPEIDRNLQITAMCIPKIKAKIEFLKNKLNSNITSLAENTNVESALQTELMKFVLQVTNIRESVIKKAARELKDSQTDNITLTINEISKNIMHGLDLEPSFLNDQVLNVCQLASVEIIKHQVKQRTWNNQHKLISTFTNFPESVRNAYTESIEQIEPFNMSIVLNGKVVNYSLVELAEFVLNPIRPN